MSKSKQEPIVANNASVPPRTKWKSVIHYGVRLILLVSILCFLIIIILPAFSRAGSRPPAVCAVNLGRVARACLIYSEKNNGALPPSLDVLLEGGEHVFLQPRDLVCPKCKTSYIYIPGQHYMDDARNILAYEPLSNHQGEGTYVAFLDGHCKWHTAEDLKVLLADTKARLAQAKRARAATQPAERSPCEELSATTDQAGGMK